VEGEGVTGEKLLALCFGLLILAQAWGVRRIVGTWLFPAALFGLFWAGMTLIPLVMLLDVPIDPIAVGYILLCTLAFSASALLFPWRSGFARNRDKRDPALIYGSRFLARAFWVSVVAALVLIVLNTSAQGISRADLLFNLFATAEAYARLRYADALTTPLYERWSVVAMYLGVMIGGLRYLSATAAGRRRIVFWSFFPSILIALTQSSKWHLLLSIVLFYAGVLVYRLSAGSFELVGRAGRRTAFLYGGAAALVIAVSFLSRGVESGESLDVGRWITTSLATYSSGHLYAFGDWFAWSLGRPSLMTYDRLAATPGFYTFATLYKVAGSSEILGVYGDSYTYGGVLITNVFTIFRGAIIDFGYAGTLLFMALTGAFFHGSYYALLTARRPVLAVVTFIFMMGFFFSSFVVSMFGSNITYYVTSGLLWLVLWANVRALTPRRPEAA
jgi:oligosaccharide repeat unit polymerase